MLPICTPIGLARTSPNPRRHKRAFFAIWVALAFLMLLGFAGIAIDTGYCVLVGNDLRSAAESASLGAALQLQSSPANVPTVAASLAQQNKAGGAAVLLNTATDVTIGSFDMTTRTFTANGSPTNAVKVRARRTSDSPGGSLSLFFGSVFGVPTVDLTRSATAMVSNVVVPGLLVLNRTADRSLSVTGGATVVVDGGIQVDSSSDSAMSMTGGSSITGAQISIVGDYSFSGHGSASPTPAVHQPYMADPLGGLPAPVFPADQGTVKLTGGASRTISPGYYSGGIDISGNSSLTLNPGTYVLAGSGLSLSGGTSLTGLNVTLYITGGAAVNLSGGGAVTLTPPTSGTYSGITIFQDRTNTQNAEISGGASSVLNGMFYFPAALVTLTGGSGGNGISLIADQLVLTGQATIHLGGGGQVSASNPCLVE